MVKLSCIEQEKVFKLNKEAIKKNIKYTVAYAILKFFLNKLSLFDWYIKDSPIPPPHIVKIKTVKRYAKKNNIKVFVETGTYRGDMIYAVRRTFKNIISIELDKILYENAKNCLAKFKHISILPGDSSNVLPTVLKKVEEPCVFWLDGHYSGGNTAKSEIETPIIKELLCIFNHPIKKHIILIDDARFFVGANDYPDIEYLKDLVLRNYPNCSFEIKDDIIRVDTENV